MFVPRSSINNESGLIMVFVIVIGIALSIVALGFLSTSVSQVKAGKGVEDSVKSEILALGAFSRYYQNRTEGGGTPGVYTETIDNKVYTITVTTNPGAGPNATDEVNVQIDY